MKNLIILYNPYYNNEVIEDHVRILNKYRDITEAKVAFGKVHSARRDYDHPYEDIIDQICESASSKDPIQLFLTDFSSMYVCYVEKVTDKLEDVEAPVYYENLNVAKWFIASDIREITRNDFEYVRDQVLVNFTTPNFGNHTYALYGNRYDYPLLVEQKKLLNYFENFDEGERHFTRVFKSVQYATTQYDLMHYVFGKELLYAMHPDSLESLVMAEVAYREHKENATYDFSSIVILYSKVFENESYYFLRKLFELLMMRDSSLEEIGYQVQRRDFVLYDYLTQKPNLGTNKYLLGNSSIYQAYTEYFNDYRKYASLLSLLKYDLKKATNVIQPIRNEASHGGQISKKECDDVRSVILGIGQASMISSILSNKKLIGD
jgi:hypothetical protein